MSTDLAISAIAALALVAHLSNRRGAQGSASAGPHEAELERLLEFLSEYDGIDGFDSAMFQDLLEKKGFEVVGAGGSRIVVGLTPLLVAKIDYDEDSSANQAEANLWHGFKQILDGHVGVGSHPWSGTATSPDAHPGPRTTESQSRSSPRTKTRRSPMKTGSPGRSGPSWTSSTSRETLMLETETSRGRRGPTPPGPYLSSETKTGKPPSPRSPSAWKLNGSGGKRGSTE